MFCLDIFLTNKLDFTKTITPLVLVASESMAHEAEALRLLGYKYISCCKIRTLISVSPYNFSLI